MTPFIKRSLIIVWSIAVVLAIIAYIVVFGNPGDYVVIANNGGAGSSSSPGASTTTLASGTIALPPLAGATTSTSGTPAGASFGNSYSSNYPSAPVTWREGGETLSVTGASLAGNQLTLQLEVQMGQTMECVPMNMRLLLDEEGNLAAPATTQFLFPETGTCEGAPGATYGGQRVVFTVNLASFPAFITTGGVSNIFFQVATTTDGGVNVSLLQNAG